MHGRPYFTSIIAYSISVVGAALTAFAAETSSLSKVPPAVQPPKTIFADEQASLSRAELDQVVTLAKQCGLPDVAEVQTLYVLPDRVRRICVTSSKRTADRDTRYECAYMNHVGWQKVEVPPRAKRVGAFWVSKPYTFPVLMRAYQVAGRLVQIQICDGIKMAFADAALTQLAEQKVQFKDEECRSQFNKLDLSQTQSLCRDESGTYRLDLRSNTIVRFKVQKGKVVITCVGEYIV